MKTYCFKLYKSKKNKKLDGQINIACHVYNHCIALCKRYYKLFKKSISKFTLINHLAKLKHTAKYEFWNRIPSHAIQDVADRISRAYKLFFSNLKRKVRTSPPKFKAKRKYKSLSYNMVGKGIINGNTIKIAGNTYKFFKSREIEGKIKLLTIKRDSLGDFYVYLICEGETEKADYRTGESVGFDFGFHTYLTASNGRHIFSPQFFKRNADRLAKLNRALSRKVKGSNNRKRAKLDLARLHRRVANQRKEFHWKLANKLVKRYAVICIEDLNLKGMQKLYGKKIGDLGFAEFVNVLEYKAERAGTRLVKVDRYFASSQTCSHCGHKEAGVKDLRVRQWQCKVCGAMHDRDKNAAINILNEGLKMVA